MQVLSGRTLDSGGSVDDDRTATAHSATQSEQRPIVQQHLGRAAAAFLLVHQIKVPEDPVERKRQRQAELVRVPNFATVSGLTV